MLEGLVILSLVLTFLMHVFLVRICGFFKQASFRQGGVITGLLIGFIPLGLLFYFWIINLKIKPYSAILWSGLYLFLIYSLFSYVYFHFFNMSETARRVRILVEIRKKGTFKKDEILQNYPCCDIVSNRLNRLVALGELRLSEDRYLIGRGMFIFPAKALFYFRKVLYPQR